MWWDANACVSLSPRNNLLCGITCSERCSLADLDCLFQGSPGQCPSASSQEMLYYLFPLSRRSFSLSLAYHKHPRTCVYFLLLSPSSSRTRNLHALRPRPQRPARLNLSFILGARRSGKGRRDFFLSEMPFPLPKRETNGGPCPLWANRRENGGVFLLRVSVQVGKD